MAEWFRRLRLAGDFLQVVDHLRKIADLVDESGLERVLGTDKSFAVDEGLENAVVEFARARDLADEIRPDVAKQFRELFALGVAHVILRKSLGSGFVFSRLRDLHAD